MKFNNESVIGGALLYLSNTDFTSYCNFTLNNTIFVILFQELSLSPTSTGFKMWRETPIPMYLEIYFFNWTNPDEVKAGKAKPRVQQLGPYTYM